MTLIDNDAGFRQRIVFDGLEWGRAGGAPCWPTDVDAVLDLKGQMWVVIEVKKAGVEVKTGQRLSLSRMVDDLGVARPTLGLIVRHTMPAKFDVNLVDCVVDEFRVAGMKGMVWTEGRWHTLQVKRNTKDVICAVTAHLDMVGLTRNLGRFFAGGADGQ